MRFSSDAIDFLRTAQAIQKDSTTNKKYFYDFDTSVVEMAEFALRAREDMAYIPGIKACIEFSLGEITYQTRGIFGIPSTKSKLFDSLYFHNYSIEERDAHSLLADSLILSIIAYRPQLNDKSTGLSQIVKRKITAGFMYSCIWAKDRPSDLNPKNNKLIAQLDVKHISSFISGYEHPG